MRRPRTIRTMVEKFAMAIIVSSAVPPIEPDRILLANQKNVALSKVARIGIPVIRNTAIVAVQDPITGNQPIQLWTTIALIPMFSAIKKTTRMREWKRSDRKVLTDEIAALAQADMFPRRKK